LLPLKAAHRERRQSRYQSLTGAEHTETERIGQSKNGRRRCLQTLRRGEAVPIRNTPPEKDERRRCCTTSVTQQRN
jgi:hypothetical protein